MNKKNLKQKYLVVCLALLSTLSIVFSTQISTGFNYVLGSRFDGLIETSILMHWFNFFSGHSNWNEVGYFYPYKDTLGYNDGYFLFGVIFSLYKCLGFDVFLASEFVNISLKIIGFVSFIYLAYKVFRANLYAAIAGAVIFTLSNALSMQMHHAQLLSISFSPILTIFIFKYISAIISGCNRKAIVFGCFSAVFISMWLITTYYMAWFYILFSIIFLFFFLFHIILNKRIRYSLSIKVNFLSFIAPLFLFCISIIPFLMVYLPKAKETGGQSLDSVIYYAPSLANLIDPGKTNLLFGNISNVIFQEFFPSVQRVGELNVGFPPIVICLLFISLFFIFRIKQEALPKTLISSLILALIASFVIMIKYNDFFLWEYVWKFIPGAKGMRVTSRYALFLIFPMSVFATLLISNKLFNISKPIRFILCFLLMGEQVNLAHSANFNRLANLNFLNNVQIPPKDCSSFYVLGQRRNEFPINEKSIDIDLYPHNVDAMFISEIYHLRTINGFSTFNPKDWDFKKFPLETYMFRVNKYVNEHSIRNGLCELNLTNLKWTYFPDNENISLSSKVEGRIVLNLKAVSNNNSLNSKQSVTIQILNHSDLSIGEGTYNSLNIGVRLYDQNNSLINMDFARFSMPYIHSGSGKVELTIDLPQRVNKGFTIQIVPVEEGIGWLDGFGVKPLAVKF